MEDKNEYMGQEMALHQEFEKICNGNNKLLEEICHKNGIDPEYVIHILAWEKEEVHKKKRAGIYLKLREIIEIMVE